MAANSSHDSSREECPYDFVGNPAPNSRKCEQLYDRILATSRQPRAKTVSTRYSEFKPSNRREHCIRELLDTEASYCEALSIIIERFHNKLTHRLDEYTF